MTNHWQDIANSTLVVVWGANPSENHPACMAHINRARYPKQFFASSDARSSKQAARMIVIDPRKNRTAQQADDYVRIRPGTDIAFQNGVIKYIIDQMESGTSVSTAAKTAFFAYLNQTGNGTFYTDGSASLQSKTSATVAGSAKYTDARFLVNGTDTDYVRGSVNTLGAVATTETAENTISNFPTKSTNCQTGNTVYNRLKAHVAPYTTAKVVEICECADTDISLVGDAIIANSRCSSVGKAFVDKKMKVRFTQTAGFQNGAATTAQDAIPLWASGVTVSSVTSLDGLTNYSNGTDYTFAATGTITRVATGTILDKQVCLVTYSGTTDQAPQDTYRATTILYAMGITQHTCGSQNVKGFANLQGLMGNNGRAGGGINALRGIHNVQGSTDMGLLYGNIPGYSNNPSEQPAEVVTLTGTTAVALQWKNYDNTAVTITAVQSDASVIYAATDYDLVVNGSGYTTIARSATSTIADGATVYVSYTHAISATAAGPAKVYNAFGRYVNALWGLPVHGTAGRSQMNLSYDDAYTTTGGIMQLQQRGFYNMTLKWFGDYATYGTAALSSAKRTAIDATYGLWPKGNGDNHIKMFRNMASGSVKAAVVWGQNPAVTEPNQSKIRDGLHELDLLVVADMFETETAGCGRKATGVTYLLPAASHVEKAGSATNSGRVLQWRYKAIDPVGNSKDDLELLLRFARALNDAHCFKHIETANGWTADTAYTKLYATPYGWDPKATIASVGNSTDFKLAGNLSSAAIDFATVGVTVGDGTTYASLVPSADTRVNGAEFVAEMIFREWAAGNGSTGAGIYTTPNGTTTSGGTLWIYVEGYDQSGKTGRLYPEYTDWGVFNRSKSRDRQDPYGVLATHKWGYCWLVNRRVFYNNNEIAGDQPDFFMSPDSCTRLFAPDVTQPAWTPTGSTIYNYARWYRTIGAPTKHVLADKPLFSNGLKPSVHVVPGRFPSHVEPYETPSPAIADDPTNGFGYNSTLDTAINAVGARNLLYSGSAVGTSSTYPLVLTTVRCVEHFQGGPITRNNWFNVELEPQPWIEINSADARIAGIKDGNMVRVVTARVADNAGNFVSPANYGQGFIARVGSGLSAGQKVAAGVVAIPWHWGEKGLSTGSRANDLTIDAMDANTTIPEFKACLCRIEKI